jgi:hemerythrin-like metal-binding protein
MDLDIQYQTGLLWQDCQHKEWISLLDQMKEAANNVQDQQLFLEAISFLAMYVNHHFSLEEAYMKQYQYPEERFHREEHRIYILRLKDFREKHREYSTDGCIKIIENMTNWVYSHIMENDKKLGEFILRKEQPHLNPS